MTRLRGIWGLKGVFTRILLTYRTSGTPSPYYLYKLDLVRGLTKGADLSSLEPPGNAVEVEGVVADTPGDCALLVLVWDLVRLALDAYKNIWVWVKRGNEIDGHII